MGLLPLVLMPVPQSGGTDTPFLPPAEAVPESSEFQSLVNLPDSSQVAPAENVATELLLDTQKDSTEESEGLDPVILSLFVPVTFPPQVSQPIAPDVKSTDQSPAEDQNGIVGTVVKIPGVASETDTGVTPPGSFIASQAAMKVPATDAPQQDGIQIPVEATSGEQQKTIPFPEGLQLHKQFTNAPEPQVKAGNSRRLNSPSSMPVPKVFEPRDSASDNIGQNAPSALVLESGLVASNAIPATPVEHSPSSSVAPFEEASSLSESSISTVEVISQAQDSIISFSATSDIPDQPIPAIEIDSPVTEPNAAIDDQASSKALPTPVPESPVPLLTSADDQSISQSPSTDATSVVPSTKTAVVDNPVTTARMLSTDEKPKVAESVNSQQTIVKSEAGHSESLPVNGDSEPVTSDLQRSNATPESNSSDNEETSGEATTQSSNAQTEIAAKNGDVTQGSTRSTPRDSQRPGSRREDHPAPGKPAGLLVNPAAAVRRLDPANTVKPTERAVESIPSHVDRTNENPGIGISNNTVIASTAIAAPEFDPNTRTLRFPQETPLVSQLSGGIEVAAGDNQSLSVELQPGELGHVRIDVSRHKGLLTASIDVERPSTGHLVTENLSQLKESLHAAGIQVERIEVSVNPRTPPGESLNSAAQWGQGESSRDSAQQESNSRRQSEAQDDPRKFRREKSSPPALTRSRGRILDLDIKV